MFTQKREVNASDWIKNLVQIFLKFCLFIFCILVLLYINEFFGLNLREKIFPPKVITDEQVEEFKHTNSILTDTYSGFSHLAGDNEQKAYIKIVNELNDLNNNINLKDYNISSDEISGILWTINKDHPEYFYVDWNKASEYSKDKESKITEITIPFTLSNEQIKEKQKLLEDWKNSAFSEITSEMDPLQKVRIIHDYLIDTVSYQMGVPNDQNILSVVENQKTVCTGYAKAFQYLLNQAGIFATCITGNTNKTYHAWNLVNINGEYGWFDVTWDDPSFTASGIPEGSRTYAYYGISTGDLLKTHKIDKDHEWYAFVNLTPTYNYYQSNGLYFDLNQPNALAGIIQKLTEAKKTGEKSLEVEVNDRNQANQLISSPSILSISSNYVLDPVRPIIHFVLN